MYNPADFSPIVPAAEGSHTHSLDQRRAKTRRRPHGSYMIAKRIFDLTVASFLLLFLLPVFIIIGCAIRLESRGPILFRQIRNGLNGQPFVMFKFRTMHHGQEIARQAERGDDRVTRVGRILRETSMDELPQLLNVICGSMSIIGPRPHPVWLDAEYSALIAHYDTRFMVKPGITGLAQVNKCRGQTPTLSSMEERIGWDRRYTREISLQLDLWIIFHSIFVVLSRDNAL
jgi:putative colanic acid biosynthesis UDP-glucose lipid carrier transferase